MCGEDTQHLTCHVIIDDTRCPLSSLRASGCTAGTLARAAPRRGRAARPTTSPTTRCDRVGYDGGRVGARGGERRGGSLQLVSTRGARTTTAARPRSRALSLTPRRGRSTSPRRGRRDGGRGASRHANTPRAVSGVARIGERETCDGSAVPTEARLGIAESSLQLDKRMSNPMILTFF